MKDRDLGSLEASLGYSFQRPELLRLALTHSSHAREQSSAASDNEQLEFLGDTVLALIVSEELLDRFPHLREGDLSKLRAHVVSEKHLFQVAQKLDLGRFLELGRGEEKSGGRAKAALLADALEAVLAAAYRDSGLETARRLVRSLILDPELERLNVNAGALPVIDTKSALQELLQAAGRQQPVYVLVGEQGPEHKKCFTIEARLHLTGPHSRIEFVGRAEGSTKKKAEQEAARLVLEYLTNSEKKERAETVLKV